MNKFSFAGHDTFHCRNYWLKKGLDHIWDGNKFNNEAVVHLGVGKNMVVSIRFWLRAFGLLDQNDMPNRLAEVFFTEDGFDPYCEDIGTIWLLHYQLVTTGKASTNHIVFNEFRKERIEFNREHLLNYLEMKCNTEDIHFHQNSLKKDIGVFINNYIISEKTKGVEEDFSGLLYELGLLKRLDKSGSTQWYSIENTAREELPAEIVLFCILNNAKYGSAVSFNELLNDVNSVGSVFALSSTGLMEKIEAILDYYPNHFVFTDDGGVRVLQIKESLDPWGVLKNYYGK